MSNNQDHYAVLGVTPDAEDVVIRAAYKALAQRYHPDKAVGDPMAAQRKMQAITLAYRVLSDPKQRQIYDAIRQRASHSNAQETEAKREAEDARRRDEEVKRKAAAEAERQRERETEDTRRRDEEAKHKAAAEAERQRVDAEKTARDKASATRRAEAAAWAERLRNLGTQGRSTKARFLGQRYKAWALAALLVVGGVSAAMLWQRGEELVLIPAGCFEMGSSKNEPERSNDEGPQHKVCIKEPFYLGKTEVTQAQWVAVMGSNPSGFQGANLPVEQVSWDDIQKFIRKLNAQTGKQYRLPSEAEWEYAARAETTVAYHFGNTANQLDRYAWYGGLSTHPVGEKSPNAWGLYDMHGNVSEWVQDCWHRDYEGAPTDGSAWERDCSESRVLRGGSWNDRPEGLRSANRNVDVPDFRYSDGGFRLVLAARTLL